MNKNLLTRFLFLIFLIIFLFCSYLLVQRYYETQKQDQQLKNIEQIVNSAIKDSLENYAAIDLTPFKQSAEAEDRIKIALAHNYLKEANDDYLGWITIPSSAIDYPVLQNKTDDDYYLNRNFEQQKSSYGAIYLDSACTINSSKNYIIYGHHMRDGSMFAALDDYQSETYYLEHPIIWFDSFANASDYQVVAAFKIPSTKLAKLSECILLNNKEQFEQFIDFINQHKFYDTGIICEYGDELLTLMTCEYTYRNGRIFVVAKKINEIVY